MKLDNSRMQFKRQTVAGENVLIKVNSTAITESSFSLLFTFVTEGAGELVGLGRQTYNMVDRQNNEIKALPDSIKSVLMPLSVNEENLLFKY